MNRKQLTILIVLGVIIGGLGFYLLSRRSASWQATEGSDRQKILGEFPINDVAQLRIKQTAGELNLAYQDEIWRVKERWNYPANFTQISETLRKIWELKPVQDVKVGASQLHRLELLAPDKGTNSGTLVEMKDKSGKTIKSLLLGKKAVRKSGDASPFGGGDYPVGRYVMVPDKPNAVWVVNETFTDLEPKPEQWLNKDFFKVEKLKSISLVSTNATNSWKVSREMENGELKLADKKENEEIDSAKLSGVGYALSSPSFNDIVSPETKPEEIGLDKASVATLETFENFTYTVRYAKKDEDNFYLTMAVSADIAKERTPGKDEKPEDKEKLDKEFKEKRDKLEEKLKTEKAYEKWTYLVSKWTIDPLLKERKDFLIEKKDEPKTQDAATPAPTSSESPLIPPVPPIVPK
ncbi:MAG: DUF4340 domain-containing protein [Verrucomicrobiota bacterium]|jgi:hypothetical protein